MKQLIFVTETNSNNLSDDRYIKRLILLRYDLKNDVKIQFIHMSGKGNYKGKNIISQINKLLNQNLKGDNHVIYCFDTDDINSSVDAKRIFQLEDSYAKSKGFSLIWFNQNIEHVVLGKKVESNKKKQESIIFYNSKKEVKNLTKLFAKNSSLEGHSNIYSLLDTILNKYIIK